MTRREQIASDATIGSGAEIACDELILAEGASIGAGARIVAARIELGPGVSVGGGVDITLNERLSVGSGGQIGPGVVIRGLSADFDEGLWLKSGTVIGGEAWAGSDSRLIVGARVAIFDDCFIDLAERVTMCDDTGISTRGAVFTHTPARHGRLGGVGVARGPVTFEEGSGIYYDAMVMPGVTLGATSIVGTGSVVTRDVPAHSFAMGAPARMYSTGRYPQTPDDVGRDEIVRAGLAAWAAALPSKGVTVIEDALQSSDQITVRHAGRARTLAYCPLSEERSPLDACDISVAIGPPTEGRRGASHLDLAAHTQTGSTDPLVEDLRDQLRRRGLRVPTDESYASLPLTNLKRLHQRRREAEAVARIGSR